MINEVNAEQLVCVVEERSTIPFTYNNKNRKPSQKPSRGRWRDKTECAGKTRTPFPVSTTKKRPRSSTVTTWCQKAPETDKVYNI